MDRFSSALSRHLVLYRSVPGWALVAFGLGIAVSFSPNLLTIYGIHNDYETLYVKSATFFHPEAEALFAIARPVAALLTNLPILPVETLPDLRWTRIFSLLTVWLLGVQMMSICLHRLRTRAWDALVIALATFLVLPFVYSVLAANAWAPHLIAVLLAFVAYAILSGSNLLLVSFPGNSRHGNYRLQVAQALEYATRKPVWLACLVCQLAFYDYPPNALILTLFPIIAVLFSRHPPAYRVLVAVRDVVFIGVNMVIFVVTAKLVYLPFVQLFTSLGTGVSAAEQTNSLSARLTATYHFGFNLDPAAAWHRVVSLLKVTGDVWFLPQIEAHVAVGMVVVLAIALANVGALVGRRQAGTSTPAGSDAPVLSRLVIGPRSLPAVVTFAVPAVCFVIAGSAILVSATGFITYRTTAIATAIVAVVLLFAVRGIVDALWRLVGSRLVAAGLMADVATAGLACTAVAANFHANDLTLRLARNEFAYFSAFVRHAAEKKSEMIVIVDPRPFALPEDIPVVYDRRGRAVPPYELGCLSSYCLQNGAVVHIAARELGYPLGSREILTARGDDVFAGLTCEMLTNPQAALPPNARRRGREWVKWLRGIPSLTCLDFDLSWHDVGIDLTRPGD